MWLEADQNGSGIPQTRLLDETADERPVATVDAVEDADGNHHPEALRERLQARVALHG